MDVENNYLNFFETLRKRILSAQYEALREVNKQLVSLYWDIGKMISEKRTELGWGKSVVENLARDLKNDFPSMKGFSVSNLWYMTQFYQEYSGCSNLESVIREIGWTHNLLIFKKCKTENSRKFYIHHTKKFGWTTRVLEHQIENRTFEKYILKQTNYDELTDEDFIHQKSLAVKDHYTFDFLELLEKHSERELEDALIGKIQPFLLELGGEFCFMGNQFRISLGDNEFYIDILLFHRELKCLVAIELKTGSFKPEYKGKMEFYLNVLNDFYKKPHENNAIGIIICKDKDRLTVKYSLKDSVTKIGIASYSTGQDLPKYYEKILPSIEQIKRGIG